MESFIKVGQDPNLGCSAKGGKNDKILMLEIIDSLKIRSTNKDEFAVQLKDLDGFCEWVECVCS
jgi:hypothetical protein